MTTRRHLGRVIDTSIRINTTPERAWQAWADPQHIGNWFVDRAEGVAAPGEVMTWFFDTFNYRQPVPIIEAEPGKTFVSGSGDTPGPQGLPYLMEITIASDGGTTTVHLVNSGFSDDAKFDDDFEGVVSGWKMALATMKQWLEQYPDRRRIHRIVMKPVSYTWEALHPLFHTVDGRRRWLEPVVPANSPVVTDTGRELLVEWTDRDAVLGLKAFNMGTERMLGLDLSTWAERPQDLDVVVGELQQALQRLTAVLGE